MTTLVVGGDSLFLLGEQHRFALGPHQDLVLGNLEIKHRYDFAVLPSRIQRSLIDHIGQVGAGKSRCATSQDGKINIVGKWNLAGMDAQNFFAPTNIRTWDHHTPIKATGPQ